MHGSFYNAAVYYAQLRVCTTNKLYPQYDNSYTEITDKNKKLQVLSVVWIDSHYASTTVIQMSTYENDVSSAALTNIQILICQMATTYCYQHYNTDHQVPSVHQNECFAVTPHS